MKLKSLIPLLALAILSTEPVWHRLPSGTISASIIPTPRSMYIGGITVNGVKYLDQNVLIMLSD